MYGEAGPNESNIKYQKKKRANQANHANQCKSRRISVGSPPEIARNMGKPFCQNRSRAVTGDSFRPTVGLDGGYFRMSNERAVMKLWITYRPYAIQIHNGLDSQFVNPPYAIQGTVVPAATRTARQYNAN
jgi:hypothetical protein